MISENLRHRLRSLAAQPGTGRRRHQKSLELEKGRPWGHNPARDCREEELVTKRQKTTRGAVAAEQEELRYETVKPKVRLNFKQDVIDESGDIF